MTKCALRMTSASDAEALDSDFRMLQLCGRGPALLAAIKEASLLNSCYGGSCTLSAMQTICAGLCALVSRRGGELRSLAVTPAFCDENSLSGGIWKAREL